MLSARTLPAGDVLTVSGVDVTAPQGSGRNVKLDVGGTLGLSETVSYLTHDGDGNETFVEPRFTWYRIAPYSSEAVRVGTGSAQADPAVTGQYVSAYSYGPVTAQDDGAAWYCNVSYNNVVVASQRVDLDVTSTVITPNDDQLHSGFRPRATFLRAKAGNAFSAASADYVVEPANSTDEPASPDGKDDGDGKEDDSSALSDDTGAGSDASQPSDSASSGRHAARTGDRLQVGALFACAVFACGLAAAARIARRRRS